MIDEVRLVDGQDVIDAPVSPSSVLDRRIDLTQASGEALAWGVVLLLAAVIRLLERTTWPLSAGEAQLATDALALVRGGDLSTNAAAYPLATDLTAFALFLFGASDAAVRVVPLVVGLGTIALLLPLRRVLGRWPMLATAVVMAISPTLAFASRRADAGSLLVASSLLLLVLLLHYRMQPGTGLATSTGAAAGLLLLSGPLGWLALPFVLLAGLVGSWRQWVRQLPAVALGFLTSLIIVSTALFTRPAGFADFLAQSLGRLWSDHLLVVGDHWFLTPFQLVLDEPFALVLGLYAAVALTSRPTGSSIVTVNFARAGVIWAAGTVLLATVIGGKGPEFYAVTMLPLALLAGIGLSVFSGRVGWRVLQDRASMLFVGTVFLAMAAAASIFGLVTGAAMLDPRAWFLMLIVLTVLIFSPLTTLAVRLARHIPGPTAPLIGLVPVLILAGLSLRSGVLLGATNVDRPGEVLLVGSTTPNVTPLIHQLERLSRDVTTFNLGVRDPTGGHSLTIAVDETVRQPFVWYLRDFPNLSVVSSGNAQSDLRGVQVMITSPQNAAALVPENAGYVQRTYPLAHSRPPVYEQPDWASLATSLLSVSGPRNFAAFLVDRQVAKPAPPEQFTLALTQELAWRFYGPPAP